MYGTESEVECLSVAPGRVAGYSMPVHWLTKGRHARYHAPKAGSEGNPIDAARRARKNAMDAAGWLFLRSRARYVTGRNARRVYFRQGFWTFTLPEPAAESAARAALSLWLTWARNCAGLGEYLWVAELTKRGRVHFHAIVNSYIDQAAGRAAWRRCLIRAGALRADHPELDPRAVTVERCKSAEAGRLYAAKYVGKAFGGQRADQLGRRLDQLVADNAPPEVIAECRARLAEAMQQARAGARRWSASQECSRQGAALNAAEDGRAMDAVRAELARIGAKWGAKTDHGICAWFDLGKVNRHHAPILHRLLHQAAGVV